MQEHRGHVKDSSSGSEIRDLSDGSFGPYLNPPYEGRERFRQMMKWAQVAVLVARAGARWSCVTLPHEPVIVLEPSLFFCRDRWVYCQRKWPDIRLWFGWRGGWNGLAGSMKVAEKMTPSARN